MFVTNSYFDYTLLALFYQRAFFENEFWIVKSRGLYRCFCPPSENYFCAHALSRGTKKSRIHVCSNLEQNMRSRTQNSQGAQCTTFHLRREEFSIGRKHIFKSALFFQKLHFWDYKHNATRVSDWENLNLASWRTVTNTRVMRNVLSAAVELGMSLHEFKKNLLCATEFEVFFNSCEDIPSSTAALRTLRITRVFVTVLHEAKFRFSQS